MCKPLHVLGLSGSLRRHSIHNALMLNAQRMAAPEMRVVIHDLSDLPLFNQDLETPAFPDSVARLHQAVAQADAVLLCVPEYNHGPSGVIKNALDWMSRPAGRSTAMGKPVAMLGASPGIGSTIRAQMSLRPTLNVMGMLPLTVADCVIPHSGTAFDPQGRIVDPSAEAALGRTLKAFQAWIVRLTAMAPA
ncbi:NADPH-dependent FMN reductase [Hydrogenophaga sp. OTU3427]|uniref:NADPH-dependent FMN reductase n=1 Tax=Hydrogenophaga sp. OTU3427 TaxID=3043856 RepID=UPI00313AA2F2